ncbi:hypothetical protein Pmar_PMAR021210 [Perkinsus marinus ATCC 50983]|uniref:J domain-containing protein n=1 Tax=Perkinsus marinus (strain ATCC 50983 / TXsc) TaxID=423536 RepID=C5KM37_PERM5|nr:hypothetical protein Pmar_PMAR021210 [Perkinsus marinus ATCC 50983]EER14456.1 hypothetical protein Pmar_PMAR021210 [Perkinsus marinus ATCC 50983]|eukprot:XP_002782661.1 hypothetical protein Pmar_PMAR021210 [Perkinsus marinus ATCC 50983]
MTFVHNNYKTLNVAKEASKPAIRKAYLSLAKKYHPDVFGHVMDFSYDLS